MLEDVKEFNHEEDLERNSTGNVISAKNTDDSLGIVDISKLEMYKLSNAKVYGLGLPLGLLSAGILPLLSVWILNLRLYLYYTKIDKNVSQICTRS